MILQFGAWNLFVSEIRGFLFFLFPLILKMKKVDRVIGQIDHLGFGSRRHDSNTWQDSDLFKDVGKLFPKGLIR